MSLKVEPEELFEVIFEWIGNILSMIYFITPLFNIVRMYKYKINPETFLKYFS